MDWKPWEISLKIPNRFQTPTTFLENMTMYSIMRSEVTIAKQLRTFTQSIPKKVSHYEQHDGVGRCMSRIRIRHLNVYWYISIIWPLVSTNLYGLIKMMLYINVKAKPLTTKTVFVTLHFISCLAETDYCSSRECAPSRAFVFLRPLT